MGFLGGWSVVPDVCAVAARGGGCGPTQVGGGVDHPNEVQQKRTQTEI